MRTNKEPVPGPVYQERSAPQGDPPTIGSMRRRGMTHFTVHCLALGYCANRHRFSFDELALADDVIFLNIARLPWRCSKCGARKQVEISPDWSTVRAPGDGRPP